MLDFDFVSIPVPLLGDSLATVASGGLAAGIQARVRVLKSEKVLTAVCGPAPVWPVRNKNDNKNRTTMCQEQILAVHSSSVQYLYENDKNHRLPKVCKIVPSFKRTEAWKARGSGVGTALIFVQAQVAAVVLRR